MRLIGELPDEASATIFSDVLVVQGIANQVEAVQDGGWTVWVLDEESIPAAGALLADFRSNPADPRFQGQKRKTRSLKDQQRREDDAHASRVRRRRDLIAPAGAYSIGPLCFFLLFVSAAVFFLTNGGKNLEANQSFYIGARELETGVPLAEIREGQVWRLITPIFLHFGFIHLLLNAMWIFSLGSLIEARRGTKWLLGFVLITAVVPNLAQYLATHSPRFGGLSGVVFAMSGYAWQRGKHDPGAGIGLDSSTLVMLGAYFVLCWLEQLGLLGSLGVFGGLNRVANTVHTGGLVIGAVWGWWDSRVTLIRR